jgi:hypothetical protein
MHAACGLLKGAQARLPVLLVASPGRAAVGRLCRLIDDGLNRSTCGVRRAGIATLLGARVR